MLEAVDIAQQQRSRLVGFELVLGVVDPSAAAEQTGEVVAVGEPLEARRPVPRVRSRARWLLFGWWSQRARSRLARRGQGRFARALRRSASSPGLTRSACLRASRPPAPSPLGARGRAPRFVHRGGKRSLRIPLRLLRSLWRTARLRGRGRCRTAPTRRLRAPRHRDGFARADPVAPRRTPAASPAFRSRAAVRSGGRSRPGPRRDALPPRRASRR